MGKRKFLEYTDVTSEAQALAKSLQAATAHNPTYQNGIPSYRRQAFREDFRAALRSVASEYNVPVSDAQHCKNIKRIAEVLSIRHGQFLCGGRLRLGTVQKALNLFLKFRHCLGLISEEPPHCPIDRGILRKAGLSGNWTQLDDISQYEQWIAQIRRRAAAAGFSSISEWELCVWGP